jgi:kynurenine formamidase
MPDRPRYRELPDGCAWDVLDPELGSLERLTPERVAAASRLVRSGRRFSLNLPLDLPDPPFFGREALRHEVFEMLPGQVLDDRLDNFYPQASTQWDSFGHYAHAGRGFFGGVDADGVRAGRLGIDSWARAGIAGRGVLLDVARHAEVRGEPLAIDEAAIVDPDLLAGAAAAQGVELRDGDILCVRLGWIAYYRGLDDDARVRLSNGSRDFTFEHFRIPGLGPGPALAEFLWDHGVAALAVDNPGIEPFPPWVATGGEMVPDDAVHTRVLALLGIPLGEFFDFDALADDCAADGVYEFLFTSAPLAIPGGIGSPPNALAIK